MIKKRLEYIYMLDGKYKHIFFNSFKELHMYLFEHGLPDAFQVNNSDGEYILKYSQGLTENKLIYNHSVPGSVRFEIINQEQKMLNN